jgi:hypothetical protein
VKIVIEPVPGQRYKGTLFIEEEEVETTIQPRPGCCTRTLMNKLMLMYGKPSEEVTIQIDGW